MSELRPPVRADLEAFTGFDGTYDYAELERIDSVWGWMYDDGNVQTLEEFDWNEERERIRRRFEDPQISNHVLAYVYSWEDSDKWTQRASIERAFTHACNKTKRFAEFSPILTGLLDDLTEEEKLICFRSRQMYRIGPKAPLDEFPKLEEDFEEWVYDLLSDGIRLTPRTITLEHFSDDITPFEYWAAYRKLFSMAKQGKIAVDGARSLHLPETRDAELDDASRTIDRQLGFGAPRSGRLNPESERVLRQQGMTNVRIVKPKQRGRDGGVGRKRR